MNRLLLIVQTIVSILLIFLVVTQATSGPKNKGASLISPQFTRRGAEKATFIFTIILLVLFLVTSIIRLII